MRYRLYCATEDSLSHTFDVMFYYCHNGPMKFTTYEYDLSGLTGYHKLASYCMYSAILSFLYFKQNGHFSRNKNKKWSIKRNIKFKKLAIDFVYLLILTKLYHFVPPSIQGPYMVILLHMIMLNAQLFEWRWVLSLITAEFDSIHNNVSPRHFHSAGGINYVRRADWKYLIIYCPLLEMKLA